MLTVGEVGDLDEGGLGNVTHDGVGLEAAPRHDEVTAGGAGGLHKVLEEGDGAIPHHNLLRSDLSGLSGLSGAGDSIIVTFAARSVIRSVIEGGARAHRSCVRAAAMAVRSSLELVSG